eukprot:CAMPEP_0182527258 /NCGR_PEP_ID=MMETSP1323-20130603/3733_1 /TAXON_ID=236787 /ORGANISM="Florenciella parvula, Strain RCC1693" /LENGTH=73 /DNA_ID=CAMNT_0024736223 /DNA_START=189 /DNA_END=406 /DNA_ORIENTATION=-
MTVAVMAVAGPVPRPIWRRTKIAETEGYFGLPLRLSATACATRMGRGPRAWASACVKVVLAYKRRLAVCFACP